MRVRTIALGILAMAGAVLAGGPGAAQGPVPAYATGALPTDPGYYNLIPVSATTLPEGNIVVDLSLFMPPVGHQGRQGSCAAWAVAYAARSFATGVERAPRWSLTSAAGQFSPAFMYNEMKSRQSEPCDKVEGLLVSEAFQFMQAVGVVPLSIFPYNDQVCGLRPPSSMMSQAATWRIKDFASLGTWGAVPLEKVIEQLDAGRPVVLTIGVDDAFRSYRGGVLSGYVGATDGRDKMHAIIAIGYDRVAGALKIQNSWGTGWGEAGTGRISFAAARRMIYEAYVILDAAASYRPVPKPVPGPTPGPVPIPTPKPTPVPPAPPVSDLTQRYFDWFHAAEIGDTNAVKAGLAAGLRPDVEVARDTGLGLAIEYGHVAMVRAMLAYRPRLNVYVRHIGNYLRLAAAAETNAVPLVRLLIEAGIDPNILDARGYALLCTYTANSDEPQVREIHQIVKAAGGRCIAPEVQFK